MIKAITLENFGGSTYSTMQTSEAALQSLSSTLRATILEGYPEILKRAIPSDVVLAEAILIMARVPSVLKNLAHYIHSEGVGTPGVTEAYEGLGPLGSFLDNLQADHPLRIEFLSDINSRLQRVFGPSVRLVDNGRRVAMSEMTPSGEVIERRVELAITEATAPAQDAPSIQTQSGDRADRGNYSPSTANITYQTLWGAKAGLVPVKSKVEKIRESQKYRAKTTQDLIYNLTHDPETGKAREDVPIAQSLASMRAPGEILHLDAQRKHVINMEKSLHYDRWDDSNIRDYEKQRGTIAKALGVAENPEMIDHMVRRYWWAGSVEGSRPGQGEYGWISPGKAISALEHFAKMIAAKHYPIYMSQTGAMSFHEVRQIAVANYERLKNGEEAFIPRADQRYERIGRKKELRAVPRENVRGAELNEMTLEEFIQYYVDMALQEAVETPRSKYDIITLDSYLRTYENYFASELEGAPLRSQYATDLNLYDPEINALVASADIRTVEQLRSRDILDDDLDVKLTRYLGLEYGLDDMWPAFADITSASPTSKARREFERNLPVTESLVHVSESVTKGILAHSKREHPKRTMASHIVAASIFLRLANPYLTFWSFGETGLRTAVEKSARAIQTIGGDVATTYSGGDLGAEIRATRDAMIGNGALSHAYSNIYDDFDITGGNRTPIDKGIRWFGRSQNWARTRKQDADSLLNSILSSIQADPEYYGITVKEALYQLTYNYANFTRDSNPRLKELWTMAERALAGAMGMRYALGSFFLNRALGKARNKGGAVAWASEILLRGPLAFHGYWGNTVLMTATGGAAVDSILSLGAAYLLQRSGKIETADALLKQTTTEIDLTNLFVQSGITQVGLFAIAAALMNMGLLGDDDEEERIKMLRRGILTPYDVTKLENDFRHSEDYWLSSIPWIGHMFKVGEDEEGNPIAPVLPAWYIRQYVDGFLGISRFLRNGDPMEVVQGYGSAFGSMPLASNMISTFGAFTNAQLSIFDRAAELEGETRDSAALESVSLLSKIFWNYERTYLEWGFLNSLYTGIADKYTRDPFKVPDRSIEGGLNYDKTGVPQEATLREERRAPDGSIYYGDPGYEYGEGVQRAYGSQRLGAAVFNFVTRGFDPSSFRWGMPTKKETIQKTAIEGVDTQAAFVLSLWDTQKGHEVLTTLGMVSLLESQFVGLIGPDSPALQNVYLSGEDRVNVELYFQERLLAEALSMGLDNRAALDYYYDIMNGGLRDIIWSRGKYEGQIPYNQTVEYEYLNTNWVAGPDGKQWATGIARDDPFWGNISPFQAYRGANVLTPYPDEGSALGLDDRLNVVDYAANLNTGIRSLIKIDSTRQNITLENVLDDLNDAALEVLQNLRTNPNSRSWGTSGGGGNGFARDAYLPYLNGMRAQYWDNIPAVYSDNPIIRRASIRRERFSSDRGRLNQWQ